MGKSFAEGNLGGEADLWIFGMNACRYCVQDVKKMGIALELEKLNVHQPEGSTTFNSAGELAPIKRGGKRW